MPAILRSSRFASLVILVHALALGGSSTAESLEVFQIEIDFFEDGSSQPMNHATVWTSARRLRVEQSVPGEIEKRATLVYRGDQGLILSVSDRDRSYARVRRQVVSALAAETRAPRREVAAQLRALPSDQRKAFERLLGVSRQDPDMVREPVRVRREPGSSRIAGFDCSRVVLSRSDTPFGEACVAPWEQIGMTASDVEIFRSLANFQRDALGAQALTPMELVPDQPLDLIVQLGGLPLSFERSVDGRERSAIRVTSVERVEAPESLFEAPADYALREGARAFFGHLSGNAGSAGRGGSSATAPPASPAAVAPDPGKAPGGGSDRGDMRRDVRRERRDRPANADTSWEMRARRRTYRVLLLPEE